MSLIPTHVSSHLYKIARWWPTLWFYSVGGNVFRLFLLLSIFRCLLVSAHFAPRNVRMPSGKRFVPSCISCRNGTGNYHFHTFVYARSHSGTSNREREIQFHHKHIRCRLVFATICRCIFCRYPFNCLFLAHLNVTLQLVGLWPLVSHIASVGNLSVCVCGCCEKILMTKLKPKTRWFQ